MPNQIKPMNIFDTNKFIRTSILIFPLFLLSFMPAKDSVVGTYSVSESDPTEIFLTLNSDHSFHFINNSNESKPLDIKGNWTLKNNAVILESEDLQGDFHKKWKISKNGTSAKSRKGFYFMTLCKN